MESNSLQLQRNYVIPLIKLGGLSPCNHEEADTRMFVHAQDASLVDQHKKVLIIANDSDVIVLGIRSFVLWSVMEELWIAYSSGKNSSYIAIHEVVASMERSILVFQCRASMLSPVAIQRPVSKKTAYTTWMGNSSYNNLFLELSRCDPKRKDVDRLF